jgi:glycosyltransferase involved in cell wall biosynthesis
MRVAIGLARIARRICPDVLHSYSGAASYTAVAASLTKGIRIKLLDVDIGPLSGYITHRTRAIDRWLVRKMAYLPVAHSRSVLLEVAQAYDVPFKSVPLVHLGTDTANFSQPKTPPEEWRLRNRISPDALVVLCAARLVPVKNIGLYLQVARKALEIVPNCVFVVAGDGPMRNELENLAVSSGLDHNVRFLGSRRDMVDVYHASDLFVCTSDYESFCLAVVEAMAAGKPVVAPAVGGIVDLVQDGRTGILCSARNTNAFTEATLLLLENRKLRWQLGEAGRERARQSFDVRLMVRRYEELYSRASDRGN